MVIAQKYDERSKGIGISEKDLHIIEYDEDRYLLHIPTLKLFEIDRLAYEWLRAIFSKKPSFYESLIKRWGGKKVREVEKEFIAFGLRPRTGLEKRVPMQVSSIYLNVAQTCNLRCSYCYSKDGSYGSKKPFMDEGEAYKVIDYFAGRLKDGSDLEIRFFGGEPLLNFGLIEKVVGYAEKIRKKKAITFRYSVTTNGTLFEKRIVRFLKANEFDVAISIDGQSGLHDMYRRYCNGKGSLNDVLKGLRLLKRYGRGLRLKALVTVHKGLDLPRTFRWLLKAGFDEVTFRPLAQRGKANWRLLEKGLNELLIHFLSDIEEAAMDPHSLGNFSPYLQRLADLQRIDHPCRALISSLAVDTEGRFWLCHRFNNRRGFCLGSSGDGIKASSKIRSVDRSRKCLGCFARYLCGGGCYYHNLLETGNMFKPHKDYCRFMKNLIEKVIMMYIMIKRNGIVR